MLEINRVLLLGNLTQDPETRYLPSGTAVSKLRIASNRRFRDNSGEQREEALFINVDVWGRQAETCQEYLRKGQEVLVEGRLKANSYQTQDGQKRTEIFIHADRVQFGRRPGQGGDAPPDGGYGERSGNYGGGGQEGGSPSGTPRQAPPAGGGSGYGGGAGYADGGRQSTPPPGRAGNGYTQRPAPRPAAPRPTWQSTAPGGDFPDATPPPAVDEFGDGPGDTGDDLPF